MDIKNLILKVIHRGKRLRSQHNMKEKNKIKRLMLPNFKTTVIKTVCYWLKIDK